MEKEQSFFKLVSDYKDEDLKEQPFFKLVSDYKDKDLLPKRSTAASAGYDFIVAEDIVVPSYWKFLNNIILPNNLTDMKTYKLNEVAEFTKKYNFKPTLVPTGVKAYIPKNEYLQLSVRSSCPLKNWLILANGVGIIDSDYYNNPDNEGHIYFQLINLFPEDIILHKGDKIGQGVFLNYNLTENDYENPKIITKRTGGFGSTDK